MVGYRCLSLMRASSVVKRQSTPPPVALRAVCHAATSRCRVARSASRRSRHCSASTASSISAMFSQLPCLGVSCSSSRSASRLASAGGNASYSDAGVWVFGVVLHQHDPLGLGVVDIQQVLDAVRPVDAGAPRADHDVAPASKRLTDQEQVAHPAALVLVVLPCWTPRGDRAGRGHLPKQLAAGLVQADLRAARIIGPGVHLQHVLHPPAELGVLLWQDAPAFLQPRLEPVCFKTWRTVSYDTDSTSSSSTSRSAKSRSVQRLRPWGGALHSSAARYASCSPSSLRRYWRAGGLRYTAASSPAATYRMRTRATVAGLTSNAAPIAASLQPGPASPWLAFSRMRAWSARWPGRRPARSWYAAGRAPPPIAPRCVACAPGPPTAAVYLDRTSMRPNPTSHKSRLTSY